MRVFVSTPPGAYATSHFELLNLLTMNAGWVTSSATTPVKTILWMLHVFSSFKGQCSLSAAPVLTLSNAIFTDFV